MSERTGWPGQGTSADWNIDAEPSAMAPISDLESRFAYHPPANDDQVARYTKLRNAAKDLAELIEACAPACRERSLAVTKLEEAVMWANAAIARRG